MILNALYICMNFLISKANASLMLGARVWACSLAVPMIPLYSGKSKASEVTPIFPGKKKLEQGLLLLIYCLTISV